MRHEGRQLGGDGGRRRDDGGMLYVRKHTVLAFSCDAQEKARGSFHRDGRGLYRCRPRLVLEACDEQGGISSKPAGEGRKGDRVADGTAVETEKRGVNRARACVRA